MGIKALRDDSLEVTEAWLIILPPTSTCGLCGPRQLFSLSVLKIKHPSQGCSENLNKMMYVNHHLASALSSVTIKVTYSIQLFLFSEILFIRCLFRDF